MVEPFTAEVIEEERVPDRGRGEPLGPPVGGPEAIVPRYPEEQGDEEDVDDEHLDEGEQLHRACPSPPPF